MDQPVIKPKITRRMFLKTSATVAAVAAAGELLSQGRVSTLISEANAQSPAKEDGWYPGVCFMCTQSDCITRVHVVDGVVVEVEGNPKAKTNRGKLCPRGNSAVMNLYNPWRVKAPLKRTNPKKALNEDPGWVEISWEEAFQLASEQLKKVQDDDPRKLVVVTGFGMRPSLGREIEAFRTPYGSPNHIRTGGSACAYHFACIYVHGQHPEAITDMDRCNYILNIGRGLGPNTGVASSGTEITIDAIARGCKIITVDPRASQESSKGEWLPIKPGTDLAFALGIAHTILYEIGKFDVWFVKNRTNAPYLIGPDRDYVRDAQTEKPLIWDEVEGKAYPFDEIKPMNSALEGSFDVNGIKATPAFQLIKDAYKDYTPEWAESICTIPAATIRKISNELVENAQIGATIEIDGFTFPYTPVSLQYQRGAYAHAITGVFGDLVVKIIGSLLGSFDVPGGTSGNKMPGKSILTPDEEGMVTITGEVVPTKWEWPPNKVDSSIFYRVSHTRFPMGMKAMVEPERYHLPYKPEIILTTGGNYFYGGFDREMTEKAYQSTSYNIALSLVCDEVAVMSDIVFPDDSFMEREFHSSSAQPHHVQEDITRGIDMFFFRDASKIQKPFNTMHSAYVLQEFANRLGFLDKYVEEINKRAGLKDQNALDTSQKFTDRELAEKFLHANIGAQYSLADVTADSEPPIRVYAKNHAEKYNYYYWPDNQVRHPMYMVHLLRVGQSLRKDMESVGLSEVPGWEGNMDFWWKAWEPIPTWVPCQEFDAGSDLDLWTVNWKTPASAFYIGDLPGNIWVHEAFSTFDPYEYTIWINSETAARRGIRDGDTITVESRHGVTQGRAKVTELIHPLAVGFPGYHGTRSIHASPQTAAGAFFNPLGSCNEKYASFDPITGGVEQGLAVKVYKA